MRPSTEKPPKGGQTDKKKATEAAQIAAHCERGEAYMDKGEYDNAQREFSTALSLDPRCARALHGQGSSYYFQKHRDKALAALDKAVALAPRDADTVMDRGFIYNLTGDHHRAIADFSRAIILDPKDPNRYLSRGHAYYDVDDFPKAIADLTRVLTLGLDNAEVRMTRGRAYYADNQRPEAIADYTRAIEFAPKNAEPYILRGKAYVIYRREDWPRAMADADKAIVLDPNVSEAYRLRADIHSMENHFAPAIADYTKAISLNPKDAESVHGRGLCLEDTGKTDEAIADFTRALAIDSKRGWSYSSRARNLAKKGDLSHALSDLNKAVRLDPESEKFWDQRGVLLRRIGGPGSMEKAVSDFDREIALWGQFGGQDAWFHRGICRVEQGKRDEALEDLTKCIMRAPGYRDAYRARSGLFFAAGDLRRAIKDMDWVIDLLKESKPAEVTGGDYRDRATYRAASGDYTGANTDYAEARRRLPSLPAHAFTEKAGAVCPACKGIGMTRQEASLAGAVVSTGGFIPCVSCKGTGLNPSR